jgi:hypothetical protein
VAQRGGWSDERRLDELLPRMQGAAGDFVFGQLRPEVVSNYRELIAEMTTRYQLLESAKTYSVQFSHRNQTQGELLEEYAAELKRIYDKAHNNRGAAIRREDLLRRFLDGILDREASVQIEFFKQPATIDEAMQWVADLQATRSHPGGFEDNRGIRHVRMVKPIEEIEVEYDEDTTERVGRALAGKCKNQTLRRADDVKEKQIDTGTSVKEEKPDASCSIGNQSNWESLQNRIRELEQMVKLSNQAAAASADKRPPPQNQYGSNNTFNRQEGQHNNRDCFYCHAVGHFKRDCPLLRRQSGTSQDTRGDNQKYRSTGTRNDGNGWCQQNRSQNGLND